MFTKTQILVAAFTASIAVAQSSGTPPTSTAETDPCILDCITSAAAGSGCQLTDIKCICASTKFQPVAVSCLEKKCTAEEVQQALQLPVFQHCGKTRSGLVDTTDTGLEL